MSELALINLHPCGYTQGTRYYPFAVNLDRCNTLNDLFNKACIPNKTEYLNISVFNLITWQSIYHANENVNLNVNFLMGKLI